MSKSVLAVFSSKSFIVSSPPFKFLTHFELIFVYGVRECSNFIFFCVWLSSFPSTTYWRECLFRLYILASFVIDELTTAVWGYFWASHPAPLIYVSDVCVCVCVCMLVHWYYTILVTSALKSGNLIPPASLFFLKIAFTLQGLLCFIHIKKIFILALWQKCHLEFDRDCIESIDCLG